MEARRSERPLNRTLSRVVKGSCFAAAIGLLVLTFRGVHLGDVAAAMKRASWWLPLVILPHFAFIAVETVGWRRLFAPLGFCPRYLALLRVRLVAEAVGRTVPGGAVWCETIKPILLNRRCGVPVPDGVASIAARKYSVFLSHSTYVLLALLVGASAFSQASEAFGLGHGLMWGLAIGAVGLLVASQAMVLSLRHGALAERLFGLLSRLPVIGARVERYRSGFLTTDARVAHVLGVKTAPLLKASAFFLVSWLFEALETYLMLVVLGVDVSWSEALALEVVVSLGRHLFLFLPGGLGIQDVGYVAFLSAFGVEGALTLGAALALLKRGNDILWAAVGFALLSSDARVAFTRPSAPEPGAAPQAAG